MFPKDQYVNVKGVNTRYWTAGDKGPVLLLIHGFGLSVEIWQHNIEPLAKFYKVYAIDLVGFGRTEKHEGPYTPSFMVDFINDALTAMNLEKVTLIGLSMGGGLSILYTLRFPHKVDKLVLVDSAGLGKEVIFSMRLMSLPFLGEFVTKPSRKMAYLFFKPAVLNPAQLKGQFTDIYYELFSLPGAQTAMLKVIRSGCNIFGIKKDVLNETLMNLHRITSPTLIIWGRQDAIIPLKQAYYAKEKISNSKLHVIEQCGHMPNFEKPDEFNQVVLDFLSR
jgi:4,5:9,10-diseco-3-hydroxy-5,9,17-trioxoandrosta-1(10),2-diene-4-oate hydrolase